MVSVVIFLLVLLILVGVLMYFSMPSKKNYGAKAEETLQYLLLRFENRSLSSSVRFEILSSILSHCGTDYCTRDLGPLRPLNKRELDRIQRVLNTDEYFKNLGVQVFQTKVDKLLVALVKKGQA